jgi:hypothetical protein
MTDASYSYVMCGYTNCIFDIYRKIHQHRDMNNVTNIVTNLTAVYFLSLRTYDLSSYSLKMFTHSGKHFSLHLYENAFNDFRKFDYTTASFSKYTNMPFFTIL